MAERTVPLGSLAPGVNNRLEPTQLDTVLADRKKGHYLYGADNVDINQKGYLKRRRGQTEILTGRSHSAWGDSQAGYLVINDQLEQITASGGGLARAVIRAGMPQLPVSYSRGADGDVYWSNGVVIRRIAAGVDRPIATELPAVTPGVSATSGALRAGRYLLAFTATSVDGESPATPVVQIEVPDNSGFTLSGAVGMHVYMSAPNGEVLTRQGTGLTSISTYTASGVRCQTLNTALMPAGAIVRHYNGTLLVASGSTLYVSEPYNYGITDPGKSYFPFPSPITMIEPTDNGLYIAADKTYWISDIHKDKLQEVLPYGAVRGTSGQSPDGAQVFWRSPRGLIIAGKNMDVKNVQEEALELADAEFGASLYRVTDGMKHVVTSLSGAQPSTAAAFSFMSAEVVREGTVL